MDGVKVTVKEVKDEEVEDWCRVVEGLREFLKKSSAYIATFTLKPEEVFELTADIITLYFRLPLIEEPLPTLAPSPLKAYLLSRILPTQLREDLVKDLYTFASTIFSEENWRNWEKLELFKLFDKNLVNKIKKSWLFLPSDTRPALNMSNLLSHSLLTSSISWCIGVNKGLSREESALLRLAALLHDLGKPFNYKEHYRVSPQIAEYLLRELPIKGSDREKVVEFVAKHHIGVESPIAEILKKADEIASSIDRVTDAAKELLYDELAVVASSLNLNKEDAYGSGEASWGFWKKVGEDPKRIKEMSEKFVVKVRSLSDKELEEKFGQGDVEKELTLCCVDIGNVQNFIMRTKELRCVAASSMLVDIATVAYIPLLIQMEIDKGGIGWVPFETFLYNLGGIVTFIAPTKVINYLEEHWDRIRRHFKGYFDIYLAKTPLCRSYYKTSANLASEIALKKITTDPLDEEVKQIVAKTSPKERCSMCYSEAPTTSTKYGEKICKTCSELYKFGSEIHFAKRWSSELSVKDIRFTPADCFKITYEELEKEFDIMYFIAGHSREEIEKGKRKRNLAVMKIDGNLMGAFFAGSISIADAVERSMRVDLALKDAFEEAAARIFETITKLDDMVAKQTLAKQTLAALKLGLLYMGGDDALIICPSWVALPLAVDIAEKFNSMMGGECSLSIGLVAAPPEHDIWALIDGASKLLNKAKKEVGRRSSTGALCFDIVESGVLSGGTAEGRFEELKALCLTAQPFSILKDDKANTISVSEILEALGLGDVYVEAFHASRLDEKDNICAKKLKEIREAIRNSVKISGDFKSSRFDVQLIFAHRMAKGVLKDKKEGYKALLQLFRIWFERKHLKLGFPLSDVDRLIKILGGGAI